MFPKYQSHEDVERRLEQAKQRNIPMFIKTKDSTYRQVCRVQLTDDGFHGANASPWDRDVTGTELVIAHETMRFNLSPLGDEAITPSDITLQCKNYVDSLPAAIAGSSGSSQTRHVASAAGTLTAS